MIRVLLDTNVVLDALLNRQPWNVQAGAIWKAHLDDQIAAHMTATAVTDVFYVARRHAAIRGSAGCPSNASAALTRSS